LWREPSKVLYKKKGEEKYDKFKKELLAKILKVQAAYQKYFGSKTKTMPWRMQVLKEAIEVHMDGGWYGYHPKQRSLKYH
jgi:hypothetical protein